MLWRGEALSFLERLCIQSFLDGGHQVALYTCGPVAHVPDGVDLRDAGTILPLPDFHADLFRYRLLAASERTIWVDADVCCLRRFAPVDGHFHGWESDHHVNGGILALPRNGATLRALLAFTADLGAIPPWESRRLRRARAAAAEAGAPIPTDGLTWGAWGAKALTHFLKETGEIAHSLSQETLHPVALSDWRSLYGRGRDLSRRITGETRAVRLHAPRAHTLFAGGGLPDPESLVGNLLRKHRIDPCDAPLPGAPEPDRDHPFARAYREATEGTVHAAPMAAAGLALREEPPATGRAAADQFEGLMSRMRKKQDMLGPHTNPPRSERITIVTSMKNEGAFILEWVAYHLSIGVTHFLVYTNDCDDPTDAILERLAESGLVTRLDNPFDRENGQKPQRGALNDAAERREVREADWVGVIDVDEFVNIHVGDGTFAALLDAANHPNVISMTWRFFGNRDVHAYEDRWQTEQFTACAPRYIPKPRLGWGFKSFYRPDGPFAKIGVHRPLDLDPDRADEVRWVNGSGRAMPERVARKAEWFSRKDTIGYDMVTLNHYVLRSAESFLVKRQRGRINHVDQDQGVAYWASRNYATETDLSIQEHLPRARTVLARLLEDERLANLHAEAAAWHRSRIAALMAEPEYRALYDAITDPALPDAIWRERVPDDPETALEAAE